LTYLAWFNTETKTQNNWQFCIAVYLIYSILLFVATSFLTKKILALR